MIDSLNQVIEKGGIWAGISLLALSILRFIGMRASKDVLTLKADAADRDAWDRLVKRVAQLDSRLDELETVRNRLFGFITKCMSYISQCQTCAIKDRTKLVEIEKEYKQMVDLIGGAEWKS